MLNDFENEIQNFTQWYIEVKSFLLIAEEIDKVYFQVYNELRYSLDHFVRAILYSTESDVASKSKETSTRKAIEAATNHLQRAYSDVFEWYYLNVRNICSNILAPYTQQQIAVVIPDYFSQIRPTLDEIGDVLSTYKEGKASEHNNIAQDKDNTILSDYISVLKDIYKRIRNSEGTLIDLAQRQAEEQTRENKITQRKAVFKDILIPIITAVAGGVLTAIIISLLWFIKDYLFYR